MKITLNNEEYNLDNLTAEQETKLADFLVTMQVEDDPFDIKGGDEAYCINEYGEVCYISCVDDDDYWYHRLQAVANLCKDKELLKLRAAQETLSRLIWRYSIQHGGRKLLDKEAWEDRKIGKWFCYYNYDESEWRVSNKTVCRDSEQTFFVDHGTAVNCMREVIIPFCREHPELGYKVD